MMLAKYKQMTVHLWGFSRVEHWQGDWRMTELSRIDSRIRAQFELLLPCRCVSGWHGYLLFSCHHHPSLATVTGARLSRTSLVSRIPHTHLIIMQPWLQSCSRIFLMSINYGPLEVLIRGASQLLQTARRYLLSDFSPTDDFIPLLVSVLSILILTMALHYAFDF